MAKMKINRLEDLECWREARGLTKNLYEFWSAYDHCVKVRKIIDGLIRYLKQHQKKPPQSKAIGHFNDQPAKRAKPA
jgi:hypothetical protein